MVAIVSRKQGPTVVRLDDRLQDTCLHYSYLI